MKTCKYCSLEILSSQPEREMCRACNKLHMLEYDRLRVRIERKRNPLELFEFHKCVICKNSIEWGTDVCMNCRKRRDVISKRLIEEFKQSIKEQQEEEKK